MKTHCQQSHALSFCRATFSVFFWTFICFYMFQQVSTPYFLHVTRKSVVKCDTFRSTPLAVLAIYVTKLYVPVRVGYVPKTFSPGNLQIFVQKLYVHIFSGAPLSQSWQSVSQSYTFLYVQSSFEHRLVILNNLVINFTSLYVAKHPSGDSRKLR
jgi:hypothetical protein